MPNKSLKDLLDSQTAIWNDPLFIKEDPISIPHKFSRLQDIEISGFWVAMLSWGLRKTIISKSSELMELMDNAPYDFIINHEEKDRKRFEKFKHRTFQAIDTLYFLDFFQRYYRKHDSLEQAFSLQKPSMRQRLIGFHDCFFDDENAPTRTKKHVATPMRNSACKRINMFLRWMVRKDDKGVDFGLWKTIDPSELMIPLDVHVFKVARNMNLLKRDKPDWMAVEELTNTLRAMCPEDPVKYDYALFSIGLHNRLTFEA